LYVIIILLHDLTLLRCKTCAIDIGSLKATYLLTYLYLSICWSSIDIHQSVNSFSDQHRAFHYQWWTVRPSDKVYHTLTPNYNLASASGYGVDYI